MKVVMATLVCLLTFVMVAHSSEWRFPGEFEEQEAVWVGWLSKEYIKGYKTDDVMKEIVTQLVLLGNVNVVVCVPDKPSRDHVDALLRNDPGVPMKGISYYITPFTVPYWRDYGPIFLKNHQGQLKIADFGFNTWGYYPQSDLQSRLHERIDRQIAMEIIARNSPENNFLGYEMTRVVSEGGDRLLNGKGTMIAVEACEFQRNPNMSKAELEMEYRRMLGVEKVIWLKQGTVEDDRFDTSVLPGPEEKGVAYRSAAANNHADEFCRFIDARTILLAQVSQTDALKDPAAVENQRRMEENFKILSQATDQDGKHFDIERIPMAEPIYFKATPADEIYTSLLNAAKYTDGTRFPIGESIEVIPAVSYCNFLISNNVVLAQQYYVKGMSPSVKDKDDAALKNLKKLFDGSKRKFRMVIPIHTTALNFGGGGIHCATQQQPAL